MLLSFTALTALAASVAAAPAPAPIKATQTVAEFSTNIGWLGSTATAEAPALIEEDFVAAVTGKPKSQYKLPSPVELGYQPKGHSPNDRSMYELWATLSPYYVSKEGWGVYNYGLPGQCKIKQVHLAQRHGTRYPDSDFKLPGKLENATFEAKGELDFLNTWESRMGKNILTNYGNQQLFDLGTKGFFRYGQLFDWDDESQKIVARSTTQERMTKTALYYLNGFFGIDWQKRVDLELIIENSGFNNTLAPWENCPNNDYIYGKIKYDKAEYFKGNYTQAIADRFNKLITGYEFTEGDVFEMQTMCAYETNILGVSKFCGLFSQLEWESYEYYQSMSWYVQNGFGNPQGRGQGIGWVEEFKERLLNKTYEPEYQAEQNSTLNTSPYYFPLDQKLYLDFTHDSVVHYILVALGFEQFKANFDFSGPRSDKQFYDLSKITPFGANLVFEVIECDDAVPADRSKEAVKGSGKTTYIHALLNENTLSLSKNLPEFCEQREDGWCRLDKFLSSIDTAWDKAQFEKSCFGVFDYTAPVTDGAPES